MADLWHYKFRMSPKKILSIYSNNAFSTRFEILGPDIYFPVHPDYNPAEGDVLDILDLPSVLISKGYLFFNGKLNVIRAGQTLVSLEYKESKPILTTGSTVLS